MILDRGGDGGILALQHRIFAAHEALQLGEFADGFGAQVGLGEHDGAIDHGRIGAGDLGQFGGQRTNAGDALALRCRAWHGR